MLQKISYRSAASRRCVPLKLSITAQWQHGIGQYQFAALYLHTGEKSLREEKQRTLVHCQMNQPTSNSIVIRNLKMQENIYPIYFHPIYRIVIGKIEKQHWL